MISNKHKPFCYAPWVSILNSNVLKGTAPCCEWKADRYVGPLSLYQNSKYLNKIKKAMLKHDMEYLATGCQECIAGEKFGGTTRRQKYHRYIENGIYNTVDLQEFDYRPSNLCNLKCVMCNEFQSSMIAKEKNITIKKYMNTEDYKKIDLDKLQQLYVVGGEPSIQIECYDFLEYCISKNLHETTVLSITTNATNTQKRWMDLLSKWKHVDIGISLDGIGKNLEYIREGSSWKSIEENCKIYENYFDVGYLSTCQAYNVPNVEDWFEWFLPKQKVNLTPVYGHNDLTLMSIPTEILENKVKYLTNLNHPLADTMINIINLVDFDPAQLIRLNHRTITKEEKSKKRILDVNTIYQFIYDAE